MSTMEELVQAVVAGNEAEVKKFTQAAIDEGIKPLSIINDGLIEGMNIVGPRFRDGEMFVPEVLMCARAMGEGVNMVKSLLVDGELVSKGKIILGTVKGDLHDIGKNLVGMMLESNGYDVFDLGVDIPPEEFIESAKEKGADIIGLSAMLTTTMPAMKETIDSFAEAGMRNDVKIIIGGAPITQSYADEIGADGFASDGASAADLIGTLLKSTLKMAE